MKALRWGRERFFGNRRRIIATMVGAALVALLIGGYCVLDQMQAQARARAWDAQEQADRAAQAAAPVQAVAQAASVQAQPVPAAPGTGPLVAHTDPRYPGMRYYTGDLSSLGPPPVPPQRAAPVQQAAPVPPPAAPPPTDTNSQDTPLAMFQRGLRQDRQAQGRQAAQPQAAYSPQAAQSPVSPPFDPTPGYRQAANEVNADYAYGIKEYNQALYRLHNLNGANVSLNWMAMTTFERGITGAASQCSPSDKARAETLAEDLSEKADDTMAAGKSSPSGGGF